MISKLNHSCIANAGGPGCGWERTRDADNLLSGALIAAAEAARALTPSQPSRG